jgi:hypothetical protein
MASQSGWERWQQEVEVTSGQWLQGQATPLLKRRQRLSRDQAVQLWRQRRADGVGRPAHPSGNHRNHRGWFCAAEASQTSTLISSAPPWQCVKSPIAAGQTS